MVPERHSPAVREDERSQVLGRALDDLGHDLELSGAEVVVLDQGDGDGPKEVVALVPRVLAGGVAALTGQHVGGRGGPLYFLSGGGDDDGVGRHPPPRGTRFAGGVGGAGGLSGRLSRL